LPDGAKPVFDRFDIVYANKTSIGKLNHYAEGARIIVIPYIKKATDVPIT
jgi:hypothetical protein